MVCAKCDRQVPNHSVFCLFCGNLVTYGRKSEGIVIDVKPRKKWKFSIFRLCCFLIFLISANLAVYLTHSARLTWAWSGQPSAKTSSVTDNKPQKQLKSGDQVTPLKNSSGSYVHIDEGQGILVYTSSAKFKTLGALKAGDRQAIAALLLWGEAFLVDNDTRVSVLVRNSDKAQVLITSGKYSGRTGWLSVEFVR